MLAASRQSAQRALAACAATALAALGVLAQPSVVTANEPDTEPTIVVAASDPLVADSDIVDVRVQVPDAATSDQSVELLVSVAPVSTRYNLTQWLEGEGRSALQSVATAILEAGDTELVLQVPAADFDMDRAGAYPIVAKFGDEPEAASFIVADKLSVAEPTAIAFASTLAMPASVTGLLDEAELTEATEPGGTLATQLSLARSYRVSVGLDPIVATSLAAFGDDVSESASGWLSTTSALPGAYPVPYGGADPVTLFRAGVTEPTVLGVPSGDDILAPDAIAPPPSGTPIIDATRASVDAQLLQLMDSEGIPLLSTEALNESLETTTPSAHVTVDGIDALAVDDELQSLIDSAVTRDGTAAADARARVLALLATVTLEAPSVHRILAADIALTETAEPLLSLLESTAWTENVRIQDVLSDEPRPVTLVQTAASAEEVAAADLVRDVFALEALTAPVLAAVDERDRSAITVPIRLELLAALGSASRGETSGLDTFHSSTTAISEGITLTNTGTALIVSDSAELPITVTNALPVDVNIQLVAVETSPIVRSDSEPIAVTIPAETQQRVSVPVTAIGTGRTALRIQLLSQDGQAIAPPTSVELEVQPSVELILVVVVGASAALLVGFGIFRSIRKRRRDKDHGDLDPSTDPTPDPGTP